MIQIQLREHKHDSVQSHLLKPDNFYKDANKEIYQSIIDLFNNSEPIDLLTVTTQLKKYGKLDC